MLKRYGDKRDWDIKTRRFWSPEGYVVLDHKYLVSGCGETFHSEKGYYVFHCKYTTDSYYIIKEGDAVVSDERRFEESEFMEALTYAKELVKNHRGSFLFMCDVLEKDIEKVPPRNRPDLITNYW